MTTALHRLMHEMSREWGNERALANARRGADEMGRALAAVDALVARVAARSAQERPAPESDQVA